MDAQGRSGDGRLRIRVKPLYVVELPGGRTTSVTGGDYECWPQSDGERDRIANSPGVTVLEGDAPAPRRTKKTTKKTEG